MIEDMSEAEREMFLRFKPGVKIPRPEGEEWATMYRLNVLMLVRPDRGDMVLTHLGEVERAKLGE